MAQLGQKGGKRTADLLSRKGLDPGELGPLETPEDARRWLETVGEAVASGRLSDKDGRTVTQAVQVFLRAYDVGQLLERVKELEGRLQELKKVRRVS